jgi:hypothetical protein
MPIHGREITVNFEVNKRESQQLNSALFSGVSSPMPIDFMYYLW